MKVRDVMTELSGAALANLQTFASAGLVICLVLSGAFTALAFVTYGERERRHATLAADRVERIGQLLAETETGQTETRIVDEIVVTARPEGAPHEAEAAEAAVDGEASAPAEEVAEADDTELAENAGSPADETVAAEPDEETALQRSLAAILDNLPEGTGDASIPREDVLAMLTPSPARRVDDAEASAIAAALEGQAGAFTVEVVTAPATESRLFGMQLVDAIRRAGLDARGPVTVLTTIDTPGVLVSVEADEDGPGTTLLSALQTSGLPALPPTDNSSQYDVVAPEDTDVRVYVGDVTLPRAPAPDESPVQAARLLEDA